MYTVNDPGLSVINYCNTCLPSSLWTRAQSGQLNLVTPPSSKKASAPTQTNDAPVAAPAEAAPSESN
jgi:hypothetical protein